MKSNCIQKILGISPYHSHIAGSSQSIHISSPCSCPTYGWYTADIVTCSRVKKSFVFDGSILYIYIYAHHFYITIKWVYIYMYIYMYIYICIYIYMYIYICIYIYMCIHIHTHIHTHIHIYIYINTGLYPYIISIYIYIYTCLHSHFYINHPFLCVPRLAAVRQGLIVQG